MDCEQSRKCALFFKYLKLQGWWSKLAFAKTVKDDPILHNMIAKYRGGQLRGKRV
jgi:hypothetical protein